MVGNGAAQKPEGGLGGDGQLWALLEPVLDDAGFELVQAVLLPGSTGEQILRLTIDRPPGRADIADAADAVPLAADAASVPGQSQGGIHLDDCARVSHLVQEALDATPAGRALAYDHLEVSSPGLERPLTKPQHFVRFVGQPIRLRLLPQAGRAKRQIYGLLTAAHDTGIVLAPTQAPAATGPASLTLAYSDIVRANLVYEPFSPHSSPTSKRGGGRKVRARAKE